MDRSRFGQKENLKMSSSSVSSRAKNNFWRRSAVLTIGILSLFTVAAVGQEQRSEISLQGIGSYTKNSTGNGIRQQATDTGGFLVGYRYHINRWLSAQADYGFNRDTQQFFATSGFTSVRSDIHQTTGGLVVNLPAPAHWRISPYALAEGGALVFNPNENTGLAGASSQARGVFVYGGGADYLLSRHFSLRAEYRGLVYKTPDFGFNNLNADVITHTAQPSAGIVFHF